MGEFLHKYNTDNVHARAVIVGLVNLLNNRVQYENVLSDTEIDVVSVPFFYSMTGDERFLQDFFLEWNDCIHPRIADGNYDVIPRGIVNITSSAINTSAMTHRFVRGSYVKEVNGELQTYNGFLNSIPLTMNFDVKIETDTNLDAFKIQQAIIETFYKTQVYSVSYKGFRVPCQVGFPEDFGLENPLEFTYQSDKKIEVSFSLVIETYLPVIDQTTVRKNSNRINASKPGGLLLDLYTQPEGSLPQLKIIDLIPNSTYFSGSNLPISYTSTGTILRTNLLYRISGSENWLPIVNAIENVGYYEWAIPFFNTEGTTIEGDPLRYYVNTETGKGAKFRAIINESGEVDKIIILDGGYGYMNQDSLEISPFINPNEAITFTPPVITANVSCGKIIGYTIHEPGSGFTPTTSTFIELKVENTNNETIFNIAQQNPIFNADADPNHPSGGDELKKLRNLNPSVAEMVSNGINLEVAIEGPGLSKDTVVESYDLLNNTLLLNKNVILYNESGEYILQPQIIKIIIQ